MRPIIAHFIKYPVAVNVTILAFFLLGLIGMFSMRSSFFPLSDSKIVTVQVVYPGASPQEMEENLIQLFREQGIEYAFTGFSAAIRYNAHVRYKKVTVYASNLPVNLDRAGLKEVDTGSNCEIFIPYDNGILFNLRRQTKEKLVTEEQLYLDLLQMKSRGEEAANEIMKWCIEIKW